MRTLADQINELEPGTIRVFRDAESDIGYREAILFVDGEESRTVEFRQYVEIPVRPGTHTLRASNRVFKSKEFTFSVAPGERVTFQVANTGRGFYIFFMLLCMGIPRIELRMEAPEKLDRTERQESRRTIR
jgi:hypothetical protein